MNRFLSLAALGVAVSTLFPSLATAAEHRWFADYDEAVKVAKEEKKDLLVDFTGSDWCIWCIRLHDEVFEHDTFYDAVSKDYVLVALDFPNKEEVKAKVPNPKRNEELQAKYEIQGFPTVLLMDTDGEVFGQTGYRRGGPEQYVEHVQSLTKAGKALRRAAKALPAEYEAAKDKAAVVQKAIDLLVGAVEGASGTEEVAVVVRYAFDLDPKNEKGLKKKALEALFKGGVAQPDEVEMAFELDPQNESGLLEQAALSRFAGVRDDTTAGAAVEGFLALIATGKVHDKESLQDAAYSATMWCKSEELLNRPEDAKTIYAFAKTLGGEIPEQVRKAMGDE